MNLSKLMAPPPPKPLLPKEQIDKVYKASRYRVFSSIFIGYMGYYLVRNSTSVLSGILDMSATEIGIISCAGFLAYGISKFVSGLISDRSNSKIFLSLGLFLSGLVNLLIGAIPGIVTSVMLFTIMYLINGWIQGMGYPPGARTLVFWYDRKERISWATAWNLSHNFGGALAPILIGLSFAFAGDSAVEQAQMGFIIPGIVCMAMSVLIYFLQLDTPASVGLPSVEEWKTGEKTNEVISEHPSVKSIISEHIIGNTKLLYCCIHGAFIYILRYGIVAWAPKFLSAPVEIGGKVLGKLSSMGGFSVFEIGGIAGMMLAGLISVKIFKHSKPLTNVLFLLITIILLWAYWMIPAGVEYQSLDYFILICLGLSIYGPVMFIGLYSMELVPKHVAGAASGLTGTFSYLFGSIVATLGMGVIVDNYGWDATFMLLIGSAVMAIVTTVLSRDKSLEL